ncbi:hypothetical protein R3L04_10440 [Acinetobacter baumannii]|uniref:hypothetical protein n=1 Tax=Acinetobacter baumannii TaxID=470 RepID=UPI002B30BD9D|nr:hypothetical protein R3L04_10440 [Acinetobacter baumannii]
MNRKQRKRKLQRAKAHQAQSKGHLEKAPLRALLQITTNGKLKTVLAALLQIEI